MEVRIEERRNARYDACSPDACTFHACTHPRDKPREAKGRHEMM
jgi:hypothetical protein